MFLYKVQVYLENPILFSDSQNGQLLNSVSDLVSLLKIFQTLDRPTQNQFIMQLKEMDQEGLAFSEIIRKCMNV